MFAGITPGGTATAKNCISFFGCAYYLFRSKKLNR